MLRSLVSTLRSAVRRPGGRVPAAAPAPGPRARPLPPRPESAPRQTHPGTTPADAPARRGPDLRAWAELLRLPALFTVPGDVLAGASASGGRPSPRTLLAIGASLCLYEAGMALNDWADLDEDTAERPHRPLPSGRVRPGAALAAASVCTAAGLALAARAGRPALAVAIPLAAAVWAYDLGLKRTPAGPAAMAAARGLDLLLGAAATRPGTRGVRHAAPSAALLSAHTLAVTAVSRRETTGGAPLVPLAALATAGTLTLMLGGRPGMRGASSTPAPSTAAGDLLCTGIATGYAMTAARPYLHAALNPSPALTQRAVGGGIRATIPLQAALCARSGAPATALLTAVLAPLAARFARKVSIT